MNKIAILLIPDITEAIDYQAYLTACIKKIMDDGCIPLTPALYNLYREVTTKEYIQGISPVVNVIYLFTDFGMDELMTDIAKQYKDKEIIVHRIDNVKIFVSDLMTILLSVCGKTGYKIEDLRSKTRVREIVEARDIYFYRAKEKTGHSLTDIGGILGKDHATVIHGIRKVNNVKDLKERYERYFGEVVPGLISEPKSEPVKEPSPEPVFVKKNKLSEKPQMHIGTINYFKGYTVHAL